MQLFPTNTFTYIIFFGSLFFPFQEASPSFLVISQFLTKDLIINAMIFFAF